MCIYTYNRMMSLQGVPKARYGILQLVSTYQMSLRDMVSAGELLARNKSYPSAFTFSILHFTFYILHFTFFIPLSSFLNF